MTGADCSSTEGAGASCANGEGEYGRHLSGGHGQVDSDEYAQGLSKV